ncbi:MAG: hypothetical protein ABH952_09960, partial [Candidatus Omnitrophota bacterium]
ENRKIRFIAKSIARATTRVIIENKQEENIRKKHGTIPADLFQVFASMFNIFVERADLRCWQTLPDQIRITRVLLEPEEYEFAVENFNARGNMLSRITLGKSRVYAGQKKFFIIHTTQ